MTEGLAAHPAACANCGATLVGAWCHACGQQGHLHDKVTDLAKEVLEGVAHLDGRVFRTAPLLALNPGRLSREWMQGMRVRFVPPLHVFLFSVFLLFLIPTFTGNRLINIDPAVEGVQLSTVKIEGDDAGVIPDARVREAARRFDEKRKDSKYYSYRIEGLAYKLAVLLAPIGMLILALATLRRSRRYTFYQHGVVALYGMGFAALVMSLINLVSGPVSEALGLLAGVVLPAHAIGHIRGAYDFSWLQSVLRAAVVGLLTMVTFFLFIAGVTLLGLFA